MPIGLYTKAIAAAVVGGLAATVPALLTDGRIDLLDGLAIAGAVLANLGLVSFIGNAAVGPWRYAKAIIAGLIAGVASLTTALSTAGWPPTPAEWAAVVFALLAGAGVTGGVVAVAPNAVLSDTVT